MNYTKSDDNVLICEVCPRHCRLREGQSGFCHLRVNKSNKISFLSYGHITSLAIDPIEKKPLFHFFPSANILSFGTYGCNMGCKFCQNYTITKTKANPFNLPYLTPQNIVDAAKMHNCNSIAFTYNDPIVFYEYAIDVSLIAKQESIHTVAISAGYASKKVRNELFPLMDAVNIDLKAFSRDFYKKYCAANIDTVLETLIFIKHSTNAWLEITNLLIEGINDSDEEISAMCSWIIKNLGKDVPIHFSAFHPAYKMTHLAKTSLQSLLKAYNIAKNIGLNYVYIGNVRDIRHSSTYCKKCGSLLIERDMYNVTKYNIDEFSRCNYCNTICDGVFM